MSFISLQRQTKTLKNCFTVFKLWFWYRVQNMSYMRLGCLLITRIRINIYLFRKDFNSKICIFQLEISNYFIKICIYSEKGTKYTFICKYFFKNTYLSQLCLLLWDAKHIFHIFRSVFRSPFKTVNPFLRILIDFPKIYKTLTIIKT